jgi:pseudouridine-5'-phosphate glycosidase
MHPLLDVSEEVAAALSKGDAVVALESTLVAHGMPWPDNFGVGMELERAVRDAGAVPATIAIFGGRVRVGLDEPAMEALAHSASPGGRRFAKCGAGDLGPVIARRGDGATTVSATAWAAARAGICLFATGGIGGVHRGDAWDVSHDLVSLSREPVAVVSAGAKAILDLPRTLEVLESLGVPVIGVGTDELPAFYTRKSGLRLEHRVDDATAAAALLRAHFSAHPSTGLVFAQPIPEDAALSDDVVSEAIDDALTEAEHAGVRGKALTPHLLAELVKITQGASLRANRALALHNARFAADTAVALAASFDADA